MKENIINSELLAPAGSMESLYAAINAGADAIYLGGEKFGARAYADNPDSEALLRAMDYVHIHGKKMYLTVNTLLKDSEIENQLYDYLLPLYKHGLDAVIVQDLGVFEYIKSNFKDLDIHASTQMAVMGIESAKLLKSMGASRIVTARELSLNEIKEIHNNVDIEIESFIHGAMCYSYSGLCLFSSIIGGRSGNRGRCAGPCRQPYEVFHNAKKINDENSLYALSLRDMNTLMILPEILESGVYSLKIEGRMKSPEYVALATSIYRKYIDLYYEKGIEGFNPDRNDVKNLADFYSRSGSTTGYYKCHNSKNMVSVEKPAYKNDNEKLIQNIHEKYCNGLKKITAKAKVYIEPEKEIKLEIIGELGEICITGDEAGEAKNRPIDEASVIKQINKTGDSFLEFDSIVVDINGNAFVPVSKLNDLRRTGINKYLELILSDSERKLDENKKSFEDIFSEYGSYKDLLKNEPDNNLKKLKLSVQVSDLEQLDTVLSYDIIENIHISTDLLTCDEVVSAIEKVNKKGRKCYVNLPRIFRNAGEKYFKELLQKVDYKNTENLYFSALNIDEYAYFANNNINNFVIDNSLYGFNKYSKEFFYNEGAKKVTLPFELNYKESKRLCDSRDELIVYGYIPLMISAGCVLKNYVNCTKGISEKTEKADNSFINRKINETFNGNITIKDRLGARFNVMNCCNFCYNIIYNNLPLSLIGSAKKVNDLNIGFIRMNFTTENVDETKEIIDKCINAFIYGREVNDIKDFTRGHFNRGVE